MGSHVEQAPQHFVRIGTRDDVVPIEDDAISTADVVGAHGRLGRAAQTARHQERFVDHSRPRPLAFNLRVLTRPAVKSAELKRQPFGKAREGAVGRRTGGTKGQSRRRGSSGYGPGYYECQSQGGPGPPYVLA